MKQKKTANSALGEAQHRHCQNVVWLVSPETSGCKLTDSYVASVGCH